MAKAELLDGRAVARTIRDELAGEIEAFEDTYGHSIGLTVVQVGGEAASSWYVRQIRRTSEDLGIRFHLCQLEKSCALEEVEQSIIALNDDPQENGIIVQMPLPAHIASSAVACLLDPAKDVDGIHPMNAGLLAQKLEGAFVPATPAGGLELLDRHGIALDGRQAVVVGRSNVVGHPMATLLLHRNATVTVCHSHTRDLASVTRRADILVAAVGRPKLIGAEMVKPGAVVVDFGTNPVNGGWVGDVDTEAVANVARWLTPVPGGTGPMTNMMLMRNVLLAARRQKIC